MIRLISDDNLRNKLAEGAFLAIKICQARKKQWLYTNKAGKKPVEINKMKLLIITQKVDINDDNLGFFHDWLKKFASLADIDVIANYVGKYKLPENAKIYSLGKENGAGKIIKILKYQWLLLKLLPKVDGVFFHMCPEYVLGAGLLTKIFRKKLYYGIRTNPLIGNSNWPKN